MKNVMNSEGIKTIPMLMSGLLALSLSSNSLSTHDEHCGSVSYRQGEYEKAFKCLKHDADQGDITSKYLVSTMYRLGVGVKKDEYQAFKWCKQAAEEGYLEAQFQVGLMYLDGEGVTPDEDEAIKWIWEAADRGYPQASEVLQFIFSEDFTVGC